MVGRALVVGAPGGALRGVEHDARAMAALLEARGFTVDLRLGATRASIIEGYQSLISLVMPDEPAVFYFAGHGFRGRLEDAPAAMWQGIVPVDLDESTAEDFRGITSCELSILQNRLTTRTRNVTTILDCCFASQMSRVFVDAGAVRSIPHPARRGFAAHVEALRSHYGPIVDTIEPLGNPNAVRVMACGASECASESRWPDSSPGGALTISLVALLAEIEHAAVSWAMLGEAVRQRVQRVWPTQRPEIEGPVRRQLFSLNEVHSEAISVTLAGDGAWLHAGRVAGVSVGDVYGVMPLGSKSYCAQAALSSIQVRAVRAMSSDGTLVPPCTTLVREALAYPIEKRVTPRAVMVSGSAQELAMLKSSIARIPGLVPTVVYESDVLARVQVVASMISLFDARGQICEPFVFPSQIEDAVSQLKQLAVAQGLRELEGAHGIHDSELELSWGTIENYEMRPLPMHGSTLGMLERPYVRIGSRSSRRLYAHVLGIGLRGEITVLTSAAPSGVELRSNRPDFVLGQAPDGRLRGMGLTWSQGVARDAGPRLDEFIVIVATARGALDSLSSSSGARARLHGVLGMQHTAVRGPPTADDALWVRRIGFALHPGVESVAKDMP